MHHSRLLRTALGAAVLAAAPTANAHISLDQGSTHESRYGDDFQKQGPCGQEGGTRGSKVYTYRPGETITVELIEFIGHPGYFRIAFDEDGDDAFIDPQSVLPLNRECMDVPEDHCGEEDFYNNDAVLLDNLDPHVPTDIFATVPHSWEVTLPNVTCDNCTLQVIQVMTDAPGIHAPYNPNEPNADDIYYQCIDLILEGEPVPGAPPPPSSGDAGTAGAPGSGDADAGSPPASTEGQGESEESGCSCRVGQAPRSRHAWIAGLFALGAAALRRRSR